MSEQMNVIAKLNIEQVGYGVDPALTCSSESLTFTSTSPLLAQAESVFPGSFKDLMSVKHTPVKLKKGGRKNTLGKKRDLSDIPVDSSMSVDERQDTVVADIKKRLRRYRFTLNNYTQEEEELLCQFAKLPKVRYLCYGYEIAPTTGTPHLQGFIQFNEGVTIKWIKEKSAVSRACFLSADCSVEANVAYCKKDGRGFIEYGQKTQQGCRTDLSSIRDEIISGKISSIEVVKKDKGVKYYSKYKASWDACDQLALRNQTIFREKPVSKWIWGPTGSGKSESVFSFCEKNGYLTASDVHIWAPEEFQDRYIGQPVVIIDEFRGGIKYELLLRMTDRYICTLKRKGKTDIYFAPKYIFITSSMHPEDVYDSQKEMDSLDQLYRRFEIIFMGKPGDKEEDFRHKKDRYHEYQEKKQVDAFIRASNLANCSQLSTHN